MEDAAAIIARGRATAQQALAAFDTLEAVEIDFMTGRWRGTGIATGHPLDGMLEVLKWFGKDFVSPDKVHPLLFEDGDDEIFAVNPALVPMFIVRNNPFPPVKLMRHLFLAAKWILKTKQFKATVQNTNYRGKTGAAMVYNDLPVTDVFRKVDDDTVLGLMDYKGMKQPYFFVLSRIK